MQKLNLCKKIYLSIFALIVAFVAIFGVFWSQKDSIASVSADEVTSEYVFYGKGFQVYSTVYPSGTGTPSIDNVVSSDFYYFSVDYLKVDFFQVSINFNTFWDLATLYVDYYAYDSWEYIHIPIRNLGHITCQYYIDSGFNANVVYIDVVSDRWAGVNEQIAQTQFKLVDDNGKVAHFYVFGNYNAWTQSGDYKYYSHFSYEPRRYYLINNFTDNDFYSTGYNNGFLAGEQQGFDSAKQQGYNEGFNAGKNVGFDEGVASANDYSFLGLMGAVVDAPLNMFVQTFDFNILGFNMKDFFLSILTIALIFTIVRLCMGGKS